MKYILAKKAKALEYGVSVSGHVTKGSRVMLNEKEVMRAPALSSAAELEGKAAMLDGIVFGTAAEALNYINMH